MWHVGSSLHSLSCPTACGILVPQPGIETVAPALKSGFLATGPWRKSFFFNSSQRSLIILFLTPSYHIILKSYSLASTSSLYCTFLVTNDLTEFEYHKVASTQSIGPGALQRPGTQCSQYNLALLVMPTETLFPWIPCQHTMLILLLPIWQQLLSLAIASLLPTPEYGCSLRLNPWLFNYILSLQAFIFMALIITST